MFDSVWYCLHVRKVSRIWPLPYWSWTEWAKWHEPKLNFPSQAKLSWSEETWIVQNSAELIWAHVGWIELCWNELSRAALRWAVAGQISYRTEQAGEGQATGQASGLLGSGEEVGARGAKQKTRACGVCVLSDWVKILQSSAFPFNVFLFRFRLSFFLRTPKLYPPSARLTCKYLQTHVATFMRGV